MKQYNRGLAVVAIICILAAFTQTGCKETTIINAKVAPNIDHITVFDTTLPSLTKTVFDDSVQTSGFTGYPVYMAEGTVNYDPIFGKTNAGTYFQIIPPADLDFFSTSKFTLDSAVLVVPYSTFTSGDTSNTGAKQTYTVYRVTDPTFVYGSTYYAFTHKTVDLGNPLSSPVTVKVFSLADSVTVNGVNEAPHLRIKLNSNFVNPFTDSLNNYKYCTSNASFLNWFKGLYIQASDANQTKSLPYLRLDESGAGDNYSKANVIIYYHTTHPQSGIADTLTQSLPFTTSLCAFYNEIKRTNKGYPVQQYFQPFTGNGNSDLVFLQNMPGASMDFKIYNLKSLPLSIINKAQITISIPTSYASSIFPIPPRLYAYGADDAGTVTELIDKYPLGNSYLADYMDGYPNNINGITTYTLNIPRTLQNAITQGIDTLHLRVRGTTDYFGAYSMIAAGSNYPDASLRLKLYVIYTKQK